MRFYATCLHSTGEEYQLVIRANSEIDARRQLMMNYKVDRIKSLDTKRPNKHVNYYASSYGIHFAKSVRTTNTGKGRQFD